MFFDAERFKTFRVISPHEDKVTIKKGTAIPVRYGSVVRGRNTISTLYTMSPIVTVGLLFVAALLMFTSQVFGSVRPISPIDSPVVKVQFAGEQDLKPLRYGVEPLMSQRNFFTDTKNTFIREEVTFIEANLTTMELRYYVDGEVVLEIPILTKGRPGSWWETPSGLYRVEDRIRTHDSSFGQVRLPWSLPFQGNFFIHGWPEYFDGTPVADSYSGGCIRLDNKDAERLFKQVAVGTPILVHEASASGDTFTYEPPVPDMLAEHYMIADIGNNTILASSDLNKSASIASITKLMTALVAVEYINLDRRVSVSNNSLVDSMIPRLRDRQTVSMYSLLQLLLLESSNEAAEVIAQQIGKDVFISRMNQKAQSIGMQNTTFTDVSGLDRGNVSTLSDLLRLAQYVYNNRSFILRLTEDQYIPTAYTAHEFGELTNFNTIDELEDFIGGKVGETLAAGKTSLTLHSVSVRGTDRVIAIAVLGSENRERDVNQLHRYFVERFVQ